MSKVIAGINGDRPAAPISEEETDRICEGVLIFSGLTKREAMAKDLLAGMYAGGANIHGDDAPECAVKQANNLLEELDRDRR
jgi:hypothetical protein